VCSASATFTGRNTGWATSAGKLLSACCRVTCKTCSLIARERRSYVALRRSECAFDVCEQFCVRRKWSDLERALPGTNEVLRGNLSPLDQRALSRR
jgi:hypothetical protein